jgi:hypothetical protein
LPLHLGLCAAQAAGLARIIPARIPVCGSQPRSPSSVMMISSSFKATLTGDTEFTAGGRERYPLTGGY